MCLGTILGDLRFSRKPEDEGADRYRNQMAVDYTPREKLVRIERKRIKAVSRSSKALGVARHDLGTQQTQA